MKSIRVLVLVVFLSVMFFTGIATGAENSLVAWWKFEKLDDGRTVDSVSQTEDSVSGYAKCVEGVEGNALLFDGFTTCLTRKAAEAPRMGEAFTFEAWVALQAYPWGLCAIVSQCEMEEVQIVSAEGEFTSEKDPTAGYYFAIDARGHAHLQAFVDGQWRKCKSEGRIPLMEWTHIVGAFDSARGLAVYINGLKQGTEIAKGKIIFAPDIDLQVGRNHKKRPPEYPIRINVPASYSFDGYIDEVKVYNRALSDKEIAEVYRATRPLHGTGMTFCKLPSEPEGPAPFGAYYTKLKFCETWDTHRREGEYSDVVVLFDEMPWRYVFWRGASFVPHWVTENDIWYNNEFNETWQNGALGCAEPMSDKQTRHSHVRIIESDDARVVVHWRYALIDTRYVFARVDPATGWGDWSDEYHIIYPDGVGIRKITLWSSQPMEAHEWQESIVINQPGTRPEDNIETEALTMVNMNGETFTYSWAEQAPDKIDKPANANIELINTKSKAKPFLIVSDKPFTYRGDPIMTMLQATMSPQELQELWAKYNSLPAEGKRKMEAEFFEKAVGLGFDKGVELPGPIFNSYNGEIIRENSIFPWWNHWPVAQIPSDGRWATEPDRVSHSSVTTGLQWEDYEVGSNERVRIMMHGLTEKSAADLVLVAKSWLRAPVLTVKSSGYTTEGYEQSERAYLIKCADEGAHGPLSLEIAASMENPVFNPAFIIRGWGDADAALEINGIRVSRGKQFRYGHRRTPESNDLIIWIRTESTKPIKATFSPVANQ